MKTIILILTLLLSNQLVAKQKIYKWTDADGNVHYTENKPSNTKVKEVKVDTGKSKPKNVFRTNQEDQSADSKEIQSSTDNQAFDEYNQRERNRAAKVQKAERCKVAKKNLATLQATIRVRRKDPNTGEYVRMDDNQRTDAMKSAKKLIRDVCK